MTIIFSFILKARNGGNVIEYVHIISQLYDSI